MTTEINVPLTGAISNYERVLGDSQLADSGAGAGTGAGDVAWYEHVLRYPIAAATDLGVTLYNLAVPDSMETETANVLASLPGNMDTYAEEYKGAIEFGSFIGGSFIPGLGATKLVRAAGAGKALFGQNAISRGVSWAIGGMERKAIASQAYAVEVAARQGGVYTQQYKKAVGAAKLWTLGSAAAENAMFEAGTAFLLAEHGWFEEGYNPSIVAFGLGVGTAATGWLNWAARSKAISLSASKAAGEAGFDLSDEFFLRNYAHIENEHGSGTAFGAAVTSYNAMEATYNSAKQTGALGLEQSDAFNQFTRQQARAAQQIYERMVDEQILATVPKYGESPAFWQLPTNGSTPSLYTMGANVLGGDTAGAVGTRQVKTGVMEALEAKQAPWIIRQDVASGKSVAEMASPGELRQILVDSGYVGPDARLIQRDYATDPNYQKVVGKAFSRLESEGALPAYLTTADQLPGYVDDVLKAGDAQEIAALKFYLGKEKLIPEAISTTATPLRLREYMTKDWVKYQPTARIVPAGEHAGKLEIDVSNIKNHQSALAYVVHQTTLHPGATGVIVKNAKNSRRLANAWQEAQRYRNPEALDYIEDSTVNIAEATAKVAEASQYYTLGKVATWWEGKLVTRDSVAGRFTQRYIDKAPELRTPLQPDQLFQQQIFASLKAPPTTTLEWLPRVARNKKDLAAGYALPHVWDQARIETFQIAESTARLSSRSHVQHYIRLDGNDVLRLEAAVLNNLKESNYSGEAMLARLATAKHAATKQMTLAGWDPMQISIALNLPQDTILHWVGSGLDTFVPDKFIKEMQLAAASKAGASRKLTGAGAGAKAITAEEAQDSVLNSLFVHRSSESILSQQPSISITGKGSISAKHAAAINAAQLDKDTMDTVTRELVRDITAGSGSELAAVLHETFVAAESPFASVLRAQLATLTRMTQVGSVFTSADHMTRNMGELNAVLTKWGHDFEQLMNKRALEKAKAIVLPAMSRVAQNKEDIVQLEYIKNALHSLGSEEVTAADIKLVTSVDGIQRIQYAAGKLGAKGEVKEVPRYLQYPGTDQDIEVRAPVAALIEALRPIYDDLWAMDHTIARLRGRRVSAAKKRGVWFPYRAPTQEMTAFMRSPVTAEGSAGEIFMLTSRDLHEQTSTLARLREQYPTYEFFSRTEGDLGVWRELMHQAPLGHLRTADSLAKKAGIAPYKVTGLPDVLDTMLKDVDNLYLEKARVYLRLANDDIFNSLQQIENFHHNVSLSGPNSLFNKAQRSVSPATAAKALLLNTSMQEEKAFVAQSNDLITLGIDMANKKWRDGVLQLQAKLGRGVHKPGAYAEIDALLSDAQIPVPWRNEIEYLAATTPELKPIAKEFVSNWSALAATVALRLFDLSHAAITTLSIPLLTTAEMIGGANLGGLEAMKVLYKTAKEYSAWMWRPAVSKPADVSSIMERAIYEGTVTRRTAEATELFRTQLTSNKAIDVITNSEFTKLASAGSDWAETRAREFAYLVGYRLAERGNQHAAPELLRAEANLFTNRAMGNYTARQRPIMFQGAGGQAIGLFQTFMWSFGQNLFRYASDKNYRALGAVVGGYGGMFGMSALPFFSPIDKAIGALSKSPTNDDFDITQRVYDAFGAKQSSNETHSRSMAEFLLYGAPSYLLQTALYTRTELQPRLPTVGGGVGLPLPPALNMLGQTWEALAGTATRAWKSAEASPSAAEGAFNAGVAMAEGLAMQTVFRPAARMTELALGYSLDQKGETIANGDEVRGLWPAISRVLGSRPLKEQIVRNQAFRHTFYDSQDQVRRRSTVAAMRQVVRQGNTGTLPGLLARYLEEGGSPSGWRQIVNQAYLSEQAPGATMLRRELDKQPGLARMMDHYALD